VTLGGPCGPVMGRLHVLLMMIVMIMMTMPGLRRDYKHKKDHHSYEKSHTQNLFLCCF
jgi:hypothetical protein